VSSHVGASPVLLSSIKSTSPVQSNYFEFCRYIEPIFLTPDGISLFGNTLPFNYVTEDIWHKLFIRLANKPDETIRTRRFSESIPSAKRLGSNIMQNVPQILKDFETKT
jgi:hypothetical protein